MEKPSLSLETRRLQLSKLQLFGGLSEPVITELSEVLKEFNYKRNTIIISQGDNTRSLYIVIKGRLKVLASDEDGNQTIFSFLGTGDVFGELSLLDDAPRSASVVTVEETQVLHLSHQHFNEIILKYPEICPLIFKALTTRIRDMDKTICDLTSLDVYGRLIQVLYKEASENIDGTIETERLTHQDLAEMVGSSREMISRILKELRTGGYISVNEKRISIERKLPKHW